MKFFLKHKLFIYAESHGRPDFRYIYTVVVQKPLVVFREFFLDECVHLLINTRNAN
jgi:hypothetical protein